jgi:hypothetical protein
MAKLFGENPSFISYMDDLIVVDSDFEEHKKNLRILFETCRKFGLVLNGKKSSFAQAASIFWVIL